MVLTQHVEKLLRRRRLDESGEAAEIAEDARDVGAVSGEELLAVFAGDEFRDLRRDESRQLRARCRSTASSRRAFAIATAAWLVKVCTSAMCSSLKRCGAWRTTSVDPDQLVLDDHGHC